MFFQLDINSRLKLECEDRSELRATHEAVDAAIAADARDLERQDDETFFACEWEPPTKQIKKVSQAHPAVAFTLWAEAFAQHHWIYKAEIVAGKVQELTLSRIDDEFDAVFEEIFGLSLSDWESKPQPAFRHCQAL